jgi:hypothetical protein
MDADPNKLHHAAQRLTKAYVDKLTAENAAGAAVAEFAAACRDFASTVGESGVYFVGDFVVTVEDEWFDKRCPVTVMHGRRIVASRERG